MLLRHPHVSLSLCVLQIILFFLLLSLAVEFGGVPLRQRMVGGVDNLDLHGVGTYNS